MKSKPFNFLTRLLLVLVFFAFVILPLIFSLQDGDLTGLALPMAVLGLWLLGAGKFNLFGISMNGRQAFAVGGALLTPVIVVGIVNNSGLPRWISIVFILVGLAAAVFLYHRVEPTKISGERSTALILTAAGILLAIIGTGMAGPSDQGGTILVEGLPLLPLSSAAFFLQLIGLMVFLGGLYGLVFGFKPRK